MDRDARGDATKYKSRYQKKYLIRISNNMNYFFVVSKNSAMIFKIFLQNLYLLYLCIIQDRYLFLVFYHLQIIAYLPLSKPCFVFLQCLFACAEKYLPDLRT